MMILYNLVFDQREMIGKGQVQPYLLFRTVKNSHIEILQIFDPN
jgi:hypothetical protein